MNDIGPLPQSPADLLPPTRGHALPLSWQHPTGLARLGVVNFLLRLVTLGVYNFWGKTEVRRRLWSGIRLAGEPLAYTGTGGELMRGFFAVVFLISIPTTLIYLGAIVAFGPASPWLNVVQTVMTLIFFFIYGIGIYRSQRFRLSRTTWRGIRGSVDGSATAYAWRYFGSLLLILPTLGWIAPWRANMLQRTLVSDMRFGTQPFEYGGTAAPLYKRFWVLWVIAVALITVAGFAIRNLFLSYLVKSGGQPMLLAMEFYLYAGLIVLIAWLTFGLASAWYRAGMMNHFARSTRIGGLSLDAHLTAGGLVRVTILNYLTLALGAFIGALLAAGLALGLHQYLAPTLPRAGVVLQAMVFGAALGAPLLAPIVQARTTAYMVENMRIEGEIDPALIGQSSSPQGGAGEGLAQAFDLDAF